MRDFILRETNRADRPGGGEVTKDRLGVTDFRWLAIFGHKHQAWRISVDRQGRQHFAGLTKKSSQVTENQAGRKLIDMRWQPAALA